jgi:hypothetical protein
MAFSLVDGTWLLTARHDRLRLEAVSALKHVDTYGYLFLPHLITRKSAAKMITLTEFFFAASRFLCCRQHSRVATFARASTLEAVYPGACLDLGASN